MDRRPEGRKGFRLRALRGLAGAIAPVLRGRFSPAGQGPKPLSGTRFAPAACCTRNRA